MRILEDAAEIWPVPETVAQINGLRGAFSADLNKPFDLKPSFPLGTPEAYQPSPPAPAQPNGPIPYPQHQQYQHSPPQQLQIPSTQPYLNQQLNHLQQGSYLATPPVSSVSGDSNPHSPHFQQPYDLNHQAYSYYQQPTPTEAPTWNPTPIIDQFNTAFAIPPSALAPPGAYGSPPMHIGGGYSNPSPPYPAAAAYPPPPQHRRPRQQQQQQQQYYQQQQHHPQPPYLDTSAANAMPANTMPSGQQTQVQLSTPQSANPYTQNAHSANAVYVTPKEWQQSVASVFDPGGLKRRWTDYDAGMNKRR